MVICAAISLTYRNSAGELKGAIICGHRHCNCFDIMKHMDVATKINETQGFINHKGEFLDRKEAFKHVQEIGQCTATQRWYWEDHNQTELYSEDLY